MCFTVDRLLMSILPSEYFSFDFGTQRFLRLFILVRWLLWIQQTYTQIQD